MQKHTRSIAIICILVGALAIGASFYIKAQVAGELSQLNQKISPLSKINPLTGLGGKIVESQAHGKAAPYLQTANLLLVSGVALLIVGSFVFLMIVRRKD
jgi:hypothetical protein